MSYKELFANNERGFLLSYWYCRKVSINKIFEGLENVKPLAFVDSGAYSASTIGAEIEIKEYAAWLKANQKDFFCCCNLDVIYDWKKSEENLKLLEGEGLNPLPVFHIGSPWPILEKMLNRYEYICLGGLVPYRKKRKTIDEFLRYVFKIVGNSAKLHGLGLSGFFPMKYPLYSSDSVGLIGLQKFWHANIYDVAGFSSVHVDFRSSTIKAMDKSRRILNRYGFYVGDFIESARSLYFDCMGVITYWQLENTIREARAGRYIFFNTPTANHIAKVVQVIWPAFTSGIVLREDLKPKKHARKNSQRPKKIGRAG